MTVGNDPINPMEYNGYQYGGLSKREWFTGMALHTMRNLDGIYSAESIARGAVQLADETIKALGEGIKNEMVQETNRTF